MIAEDSHRNGCASTCSNLDGREVAHFEQQTRHVLYASARVQSQLAILQPPQLLTDNTRKLNSQIYPHPSSATRQFGSGLLADDTCFSPEDVSLRARKTSLDKSRMALSLAWIPCCIRGYGESVFRCGLPIHQGNNRQVQDGVREIMRFSTKGAKRKLLHTIAL